MSTTTDHMRARDRAAPMVGARAHRRGPVHGHHGHVDHRRRAARDAAPTSASPRRTCPGCSTPTSSRSAACCCSAAGCPTCSGPPRSSPPAGRSCSPGPPSPALAGTVAVELAGRAIQGAGAALIAPAALTLLMMLFGDQPRELTKALALYGAAAPAGGTAGVFLGGVITEYASLAVGVLHQHPDRGRSPSPLTRRSCRRCPAASRAAGRRSVRHRHRWARRRRLRDRPRPRGRLDVTVDLGRRAAAVALLGAVRAASRPGAAIRWCGWASSAAPEPRRRERRPVPARRGLDPDVVLPQPLPAAGPGLGAFASGAALLPMTVADHGRDGRRRAAAHRPVRAQGDGRHRAWRPGRRLVWLSFIRPTGASGSTCCPPPWSRPPGMSMAFIPSPRHRAVRPPARGRRPGRRHRQHQLPGRLRPRPGRHDRRRHAAAARIG